ncbi:MAG: phytanoyl-CoA dioxygenase family protein [Proteobacteria bacterium]|nr:phytanoyl-CoA dioxygenase family protein [Pseudomonadota bacterium]MDA1301512.1 phytanoyl-CoA dioxygenase family protein [Pseudomonadota bacterium]
MYESHRQHFAENGFVNLGKVLSDSEVEFFLAHLDQDRARYPYFWHHYGYHQEANYDALITSPVFDDLIRHRRILPEVESLMGGPVCFGEIGLRQMHPYDGEDHRQWHRDKAHRPDHPLRMDYMQLMVYLTDVDANTHCLSLSPESLSEPVLRDPSEQLARGGCVDLHGPAGTCALFNVALLHTATTRPTSTIRKTVQIYYGHRDRPALANDSAIPATFWRDHPDAETRAFYGVLNERTRIYMNAFGSLRTSD